MVTGCTNAPIDSIFRVHLKSVPGTNIRDSSTGNAIGWPFDIFFDCKVFFMSFLNSHFFKS